MVDPRVELIAEQMRHLGLDHDVFDPEKVEADLRDRTAMNDGLDELIGDGPPPDPTAFDPRWRL